jgi:hypothetical protein
MPVPAHTTILGGYFEGNARRRDLHQLAATSRSRARSVRKNLKHGINIGLRSFDVSIVNAIVIANSQASAGTYNGIYVRVVRTRASSAASSSASTLILSGLRLITAASRSTTAASSTSRPKRRMSSSTESGRTTTRPPRGFVRT